MIKRSILNNVENHLLNKEITLLVGPRQSGKTYLMRILKDRLDKQGKKTLFLSLDFDENKEFFLSQSALLNKIRLQIGESKGFVFIDEIQRREDAGLFLKGLFDMNLPYKFIVSGSGSLELKEKIHESLSGRKRIFEIDPLTFMEFVEFKTHYQYEGKLTEFFSVEKVKTRDLLQEYMMFGGYPKVVLSETIDEKRAVMSEIYQSYIDRDIEDLLKLEKTDALTNLVKVLASQIGGLINVTELSSTIGISSKTIQKYLWYLEKTFIIKKVTPFYRNVRKEITKAPVYYFYDTGLRNYILGLFGVSSEALLNGHLFENFIFNQIRQQIIYSSTKIHFWRTRDNAEVDFIINPGIKIIPVEAKYSILEKVVITRSFKSFLVKYQPQKAYIVHLGKHQKLEVDRTKISLIPFYETINTA